MVTEFRKLDFSSQEIKEAVQLFQIEKKSVLPAGDILDISLSEEGGLTASVCIATNSSLQEKMITLDASMLAAIIIYYCQNSDVPIAKNSEKELSKNGNGISLTISIAAK
ncbi:MAG: hypothetical protein V7727_04325 [Sneathiella sp.]